MVKSFLRGLPLVMALSLAVTAAPARAEDTVQQLERQYGIVGRDTSEGQRLNDQLDRVVTRIVAGVNQERGRSDFRLRSAKILGGRSEKGDKVVNAFALPDGRIYVMLGLMRLIQNDPRADDELAFVVGHEVTHVVEKHSAHQQKQALGAGVAAILLGAVTRNQAIGTLGNYGAAAYTSSFSRKDEYAADKGGVNAMYRAGYDPQAAAQMLNRLKEAGGSQNRVINGWFGSHPLTENRVERVKEMTADLQDGRSPRDRSTKDIDREDRNGQLNDRSSNR